MKDNNLVLDMDIRLEAIMLKIFAEYSILQFLKSFQPVIL